MNYDFDRVIDRKGTCALKTDRLPQGCPEDAVPAWVADMDFQCAPEILEKLHERVDHGIFGYTYYGREEYKEAVCDWYARRIGWKIRPSEICFSPGVVPALALLVNCLTREGDGIIVQQPVYYPFGEKIRNNDRLVVNNPLRAVSHPDGSLTYEMNMIDLETKLSNLKNRGMILCNPHNPVGRVWSKEELVRVLRLGRKYDKWIISDEIHGDLTRTGLTYTPILQVLDELIANEGEEQWGRYRDQIIVCTAPSKTFNLAGMSLSNIIIPGWNYRHRWNRYAGETLGLELPGTLSLEAMKAAYQSGEAWLDALRAYLDSNITYVEDFLARHLPKAAAAPCQGTYLMWLDFRPYLRGDGEVTFEDAKRLETAMQQVGHVALDEGYIFGVEGYGFERVNVATPRVTLEKVMAGMEKAIKGLEKENEGR